MAYVQVNSPEKMWIRAIFDHHVTCLSKSNPKVFTLPNNFAHETELRKKIPKVELVCAEIDKRVYNQNVSYAHTLQVNQYLNKDAFKVLKEEEHLYDAVWLDLCSPLTKKVLTGLKDVINVRRFRDGAILGLTLMGARESGLEEIMQYAQCSSLQELRSKGVPKLIHKIGVTKGFSIRQLHQIKYRNSGKKSAPMYSYLFEMRTIRL